MEVCVLSLDLMFFTAVEGVARAMGHRVKQAESLVEIGSPDLLVVDFTSTRVGIAALAASADPARTAVFAPHEHVETFADARAHGIAHVYRRGALATELTRLLTEYVS